MKSGIVMMILNNDFQSYSQHYFANVPSGKEYFRLPTNSVDNFVDDSFGCSFKVV